MKFKELREKLNKMSGSKLTGAEVSQYYRKNPGAKKASKDKNVKKAIEIALDHGGAMNFAIKKIEKMKRGLADHPEVAKALEFANFGEEAMKEALMKEGTWALPKSSKQKKELKDLLQKPIKLGKEGDEASDKMYNLIGDDSLFDDLYVAGKKDPKGDARDIIKKHMKKLGVRV